MSLKILYLFTSPSLKGSSVQTKVLNQIKYLNKAGAECKGAFFSTEVKEVTLLNEFVELIPVEKCTWKYFQASGRKRKVMEAVLKYANENFTETDLFYFRYPGAGSLLKQFSKKFGKKTVFEHLSIEESEIRLGSQENPFGLSPSKIFSRAEYYWLPLWREKLFGKTIRKNSALGICNSKDIAQWQEKVSGGKYKTILGGDAVETSAFTLRKPPVFTQELNLIFLKGAATSADYNGIDRIFKSIKNYQGEMQIKLYLLGRNLDYEKSLAKEFSLSDEQVIFKGFMGGEELDLLINTMHLGVSQFGIYRKNLNSNSTIKSREYFARGLPFIYGHEDPDMIESSKEFALQFSNDDSLIDMQKVIDFAQRVLSDPEHPQKMRAYAEQYLDYEVKMRRLAEELGKLKN